MLYNTFSECQTQQNTEQNPYYGSSQNSHIASAIQFLLNTLQDPPLYSYPQSVVQHC